MIFGKPFGPNKLFARFGLLNLIGLLATKDILDQFDLYAKNTLTMILFSIDLLNSIGILGQNDLSHRMIYS